MCRPRVSRFAKLLISRTKLIGGLREKVSVEKNYLGGYVISDIVGGYLVVRCYYGYTKKKAVALFKNEMKGN